MKRDFWITYLFGVLLYIILLFSWGKCSGQTSPLVRVPHDSFVSYYDVQTHCPALVVYELRPEHFAGTLKAKGRHFKMDTKLPRPRVKDGDYAGTGYVRGHMVSAADRDSKSSWLKETYLTSNLAPMTMVCNSGRWKQIEDSCRWLASHGHPLKIVRLPLFTQNCEQILSRITIMVPDAFLCLAQCMDHGERYVYLARNTQAANQPEVWYNKLGADSCSMCYILEGSRNTTISMMLQNILGLWSREVYETITR